MKEVAILWLHHKILSFHCKISSYVCMFECTSYCVLCTHCSRVTFSHKIATFSFAEKQTPSVGFSKRILRLLFQQEKQNLLNTPIVKSLE